MGCGIVLHSRLYIVSTNQYGSSISIAGRTHLELARKTHRCFLQLKLQMFKKQRLLKNRIKRLENALKLAQEEENFLTSENTRLAENARYYRGRWLTAEREIEMMRRYVPEEGLEPALSQARDYSHSSPYR